MPFVASIRNVPIHTGSTFMITGIMKEHRAADSKAFALSGSYTSTDTLFTTLVLNSVQKVVTVSL